MTLSELRWGVFFGDDDTPSNPWASIKARVERRPLQRAHCARIVDTPTVAFHMLTWHVSVPQKYCVGFLKLEATYSHKKSPA